MAMKEMTRPVSWLPLVFVIVLLSSSFVNEVSSRKVPGKYPPKEPLPGKPSSLSIKPIHGELPEFLLSAGDSVWSFINNGNGTMSLSLNENVILTFEDDLIAHFRTLHNQVVDDDRSRITIANKLKIDGDLLTLVDADEPGDVTMAGMKQWKLVYHDSFQGPVSGWSDDSTSNCGISNDIFLGGHCKFGGKEVSKTVDNLPDHTQLRLRARMHFLDQWEGESAFLSVDGKYVWSESHHWCGKLLVWFCRKHGISVCGNEFPDRLSSPIEIVVPHTAPSVSFAFGANLTRSACEVSWGVDDIQVFVQ